MQLSTALVTNWPQPLLMVLRGFITFSQELALLCCKGTKMRYLKSNSTLRATRSSRLAVIKLAECGTLTLELNAKPWTGMKTRYSLVLSIMKVTL